MRTKLRASEEIALVARQHWIVLSRPLGVTLFLLGCLVAAWFVDRPWLVPISGTLFATSGIWLLWRWLEWRCDLWAVTSQRVIDENGVLAVRVVDSPLDTIHNVTCTQTLLGRVLNYGTVNVQTAAEHGSTTIPRAGGPADVRETILDLKEQYRYNVVARKAVAQGAALSGALPSAAGVGDTKECAYCAETIKARATVCRFCGRSV
jgi:membrane protein YdbS with pleckstrin-like domain